MDFWAWYVEGSDLALSSGECGKTLKDTGAAVRLTTWDADVNFSVAFPLAGFHEGVNRKSAREHRAY